MQTTAPVDTERFPATTAALFPFASAVLSGNERAIHYTEEVAGWLTSGNFSYFRSAISRHRDRALWSMGHRDLVVVRPPISCLPTPTFVARESRFD